MKSWTPNKFLGFFNRFPMEVMALPSGNCENMAFVLLSHILRGSNSLLPEILARSTKMQVLQVTDGMKILSNHIYVLPPDKFMEIRKGTLHLVPRPNEPVNNAINHFLFSLAKDHVHGSIGIVLSGEGSDGAEGIKNLKLRLGKVLR